jgi:hypothetical protein
MTDNGFPLALSQVESYLVDKHSHPRKPEAIVEVREYALGYTHEEIHKTRCLGVAGIGAWSS